MEQLQILTQIELMPLKYVPNILFFRPKNLAKYVRR